MYKQHINVFSKIQSSEVENTIPITEWLDAIKNPPKSELEKILKTRKFDKGNKTYVQLKESLPTATYNFLFDEFRRNDNIITSTGLLFIEIDDTSFDIKTLNSDHLYATYKSLSNKGYHIIVKVDNLTVNNFDNFYEYVCKELGITNYYDKNSKKLSQQTVLSFDKDIFINEDSTLFKLEEEKSKKVQSLKLEERKENVCVNALFLNEFNNIKFEVTLNNYDNQDCIYISEGKEYYNCYIPFNNKYKKPMLVDGNKQTVLSTYVNNLLCLNPTINRKQIYAILRNIINKTYIGIIPDNNIYSIIDYKFKELNENNLKPIGVKIKKYWINPISENKLDIYHKTKKDNTITSLEQFFGDDILNIKEKVTYDTVAEYTKLSIRTIKNRITMEMKELIKKHNEEIKKLKAKVKVLEEKVEVLEVVVIKHFPEDMEKVNKK